MQNTLTMIELQYQQGQERANSTIGNYSLTDFKRALNNGQARKLRGETVSFVLFAPADRVMQVYRKIAEEADEIEARLGTKRNRGVDRIIEF